MVADYRRVPNDVTDVNSAVATMTLTSSPLFFRFVAAIIINADSVVNCPGDDAQSTAGQLKGGSRHFFMCSLVIELHCRMGNRELETPRTLTLGQVDALTY